MLWLISCSSFYWSLQYYVAASVCMLMWSATANVDMFISRLLSFPLIMIHVRCKCIHYDNVYCKCNSWLCEEKKIDRIDDTVQNPHKTSHQSILRFSDLLVGHTSLLYFKCFLRNTPVRIAVRLPLFHKIG